MARKRKAKVGILRKDESDYIVIESSRYHDRGPDAQGDYTALPKGMITEIRVVDNLRIP